MRFTEMLDSLTLREGPREHVGSTSVPPDWMQGRSVYGGLQSALALRAMRALVPTEVPLRALQTTFIAPVAGTVTVEARVLRSGKSVIHAEARIVTGEQIAVIVIGIFGRARASRVEVVAEPPPVTSREAPFVVPYAEGLMPSFLQHFTMRWLSGSTPFSGVREAPRASIEVSIDDPVPANETHVVAIADAIPPLALSMLTAPAPGSSATWTLEFLTDRFDGLALSGWRVHAELRAGRDGYTSQSALVCAPAGHAVAISQQTMMVFG
jgi:acyl-CoA thioesterase